MTAEQEVTYAAYALLAHDAVARTVRTYVDDVRSLYPDVSDDDWKRIVLFAKATAREVDPVQFRVAHEHLAARANV